MLAFVLRISIIFTNKYKQKFVAMVKALFFGEMLAITQACFIPISVAIYL